MKQTLFTAYEINGVQFKNRFVRSATFEGMATFDGKPTQMLRDLYCNLAEGEVGMIITGLTHVDGYKNCSWLILIERQILCKNTTRTFNRAKG